MCKNTPCEPRDSASNASSSSSNSSRVVPNGGLVEACAAWDVRKAAQLLELRAAANGAGPDGRTPLVACFTELTGVLDGLQGCFTMACTKSADWTQELDTCTSAQADTVALLLQHGADPWLPSAGDVTPMLAATTCSTELLKVLLEAQVCQQHHGSFSSQSGDQQASSPPGIGALESSMPVVCPNTTNSDRNTSVTSRPAGDQLVKYCLIVACLRGAPEAMQLLLKYRLITDVHAPLPLAVQVSGSTFNQLTSTVCALRLAKQPHEIILS